MQYYNVKASSPKNKLGSWTNGSANVFTTAKRYAEVFNEIIGKEICDEDYGHTEFLLLKCIWNELSNIYSGLAAGVKSDLKTAATSGVDELIDFASLYDYIYKKYGNYDGFGSDFLEKGI